MLPVAPLCITARRQEALTRAEKRCRAERTLWAAGGNGQQWAAATFMGNSEGAGGKMYISQPNAVSPAVKP